MPAGGSAENRLGIQNHEILGDVRPQLHHWGRRAAFIRKAFLIMTFPSAHPALGRALVARGYSVPTAVQLAVLEANTAGRDLLVSAQTGSGKTVAFGLAIATTLLGAEERLPQAAAAAGPDHRPDA